MNPNVVSEEYLNLQKAIINKHDVLRERFQAELNLHLSKDELNEEIPVLPQLKGSPVPGELYRKSIKEIESVLSEHQPELGEELSRLTANLTDEDILKWIKESVTYNTAYFQTFAEKNELSAWLPHFLAEQALRPFMHLLAQACRPFINEFEVMGTCPCCGEPHRLAKIENKGRKFLYCPRCETEWKQRRLQCVHCGDDRHEHLFYITIKEDETAKLEVCETCNNYLKLVETKKLLEKKTAALLDLETIHLDFVAQEEGYGEGQ
ncbi:formate dehydrogenase accessory protein FdhE [Salipaludibacillus sp. CUR1]|uniref:formate dehydrogenase accessory protein FdhE n=1 Tax=Salipaludibacillus sp. CUR1 TaxID=2820003 RepID=UPI001E330213|nr:formate dehydrogenase accessory protein FdhE [Salipaludibacillus sp. CUR1]MCE7791478.1 formate dehydrogenase accessory protein FdhE [Salipaludibacillus sp. CUR1]